MVEQAHPEAFKQMMVEAQKNVREHYAFYEQLAKAMNPAVLSGSGDGAPKGKGNS